MNFADIDWNTVDAEYLENKMKKFFDERDDLSVKRSAIRNLNSYLSSAIMLRETAAAQRIWDYVDQSIGADLVFKTNNIDLYTSGMSKQYGFFCIDSPGYILVANEKHGDRYLDLSTPDRAAAAVIKLARERFDDRYYWSEEDNITENQMDLFQTMPETNQKMVERYLSYAVNSENKKYWAAHHLLKFMLTRSDYEYERISIERIE